MLCQLQLKLNVKISLEEPQKAGNHVLKETTSNPKKLKKKQQT